MQDDIKRSIREYYDIYFEIGSVYDKLAKSHGITATTLFVLQIIYENQEKCTQRLICEKLFYPKQTVNTILDSLYKKGYIIKQISDFDKRNKYILLTESGKSYTNPVFSDIRHIEEVSFANMEPEQRQGMIKGERAFLEQITKAFHSIRKKHEPSHVNEL